MKKNKVFEFSPPTVVLGRPLLTAGALALVVALMFAACFSPADGGDGGPVVTGVTISPATAVVFKGETETFIAMVTGTGNPDQTVTWAVSGNTSTETTVNAAGVLAVAIGETASSLTVKATSTADITQSGTAEVTVSGTATVTAVTVSPDIAIVTKGGTETFTATVVGTGSPDQTVTWAVNGNTSTETTMNAAGVLAVAIGETASSLTVKATSTADITQSGTAEVTVSGTATVAAVTISPAPAIAAKGGTAAFTAMVTGTGNPAQTVTWEVSGNTGTGTTINATGLLTVAVSETASSLTVKATSTVDTTQSNTVVVTVLPYTEMLLATPDTVNTITITGNAAYNASDGNTLFRTGRTVILSPFKIAKYATTYELWYEVRQWAAGNGYIILNAGREGHDGTTGDSPTTVAKTEPVTYINWRDAVIWCNAYSEMSGKEPVYYTDTSYTTVLKVSTNTDSTNTAADYAKMKPGANGFRLPTEAEWEYAARGGGIPAITGTFVYTYAGSNTIEDVAWYSVNASGTHEVGTKNPNTLGLYNMSGNVREWCWDWFGNIGTGTVDNPKGPASSSHRVIRGGGWIYDASHCTVAYRNIFSPSYGSGTIGFRLVVCVP
jgi:formylglycine-generating enzyme required for sulfatase activity